MKLVALGDNRRSPDDRRGRRARGLLGSNHPQESRAGKGRDSPRLSRRKTTSYLYARADVVALASVDARSRRRASAAARKEATRIRQAAELADYKRMSVDGKPSGANGDPRVELAILCHGGVR